MSDDEDLRLALELSLQDAHNDVTGVGVENNTTGGGSSGVLTTPYTPAVGTDARIDAGRTGEDDMSIQHAIQASLSPKAKRTRLVAKDPFTLIPEEKRRLFGILFGHQPLAEDLKRWEASYFSFSDVVKFGLWQQQGGPCGVLVPLQGLLLRILLFPRESEREALGCPPHDVSDERRWEALIMALTHTLVRTTDDNVFYVVSVDDKEPETTLVHTFGTREAVRNFYSGPGRAKLSTAGSVINFIYSLLMTRSIEQIQRDMDDDEQPLIGRFGHCSQELMNLMLFGRATSNVFDGSQDLGGGMQLKGVTVPEVEIGYLSEVEAMRYVTVGERFKFPKYPIWSIGSQTHYTLLFCKDHKVSQAGNNFRERNYREIFNRHCIDAEGGMADMNQLDTILDEMQVSNKATIKANLSAVGGDIFLWSDIWELLDQGDKAAVEKFDMYLYDGQDPPGPRLRHFTLETCDLDAAFGQGDTDNFIAALRTRWQMCLISGLEL